MDPVQYQKMKDLETKIDAIYTSVETTRKYMKWTMIITVAVIVIPLIGLAFAVPSFMTNYIDQIQSLTSY